MAVAVRQSAISRFADRLRIVHERPVDLVYDAAVGVDVAALGKRCFLLVLLVAWLGRCGSRWLCLLVIVRPSGRRRAADGHPDGDRWL